MKEWTLVGHHVRQLDPKGRFALPAEMRKELGEACYLMSGTERCIEVLPVDVFDAVVAEVRAKVERKELSKADLRMLGASATKVVPDKQGRITLDQNLQDWARLTLGESVVVSGVFDRLEIWNPERHAREIGRGAENMAGDDD